ncbi:PREDICTED: orofacial cleft 1 candidate gene 1 protein homolog [Gavialis gangeticus]|uniref:orofacial cleft 1 candidate gene 1 protein homolog n=1 Tax=Gavialis gangeticus TaxID=94835 RepID=UPI00092F0FBA|nr:PREDICTED: orofacial cleft 1 candidate gene 1 protein homolog [Gavialis gangeticus]
MYPVENNVNSYGVKEMDPLPHNLNAYFYMNMKKKLKMEKTIAVHFETDHGSFAIDFNKQRVEVFSLPCYISEKGQIDMDREKFQQKALKQTKQKKSKSAEFLMVKEERAATEGIENPAFNISSTDLSAYQPSEEKVIRHDKLDSTLAAHQQKLRLHAHAEPRGNEYSRNYFDPLMDEEINPRQCGMEVSGEEPVKLEEKILYGELMKLIDEEHKRLEPPAHIISEDFSDSIMPVSFTKTHDFCKEVEDEVIPSYIVQFEKDVQDDIIMLGSFSPEQPNETDNEREIGLWIHIVKVEASKAKW